MSQRLSPKWCLRMDTLIINNLSLYQREQMTRNKTACVELIELNLYDEVVGELENVCQELEESKKRIDALEERLHKIKFGATT